MMNTLHSASCCFYKDKLHVAFYAGEKECVNQRVFIVEDNGKNFTPRMCLPEGSGNPVIFNYNENLMCLSSRFTRKMERSVFDLWQTAETHLLNITESSGIRVGSHCCPRAHPIQIGNVLLMPCYDEQMAKEVYFSMGQDKNINRHIQNSLGNPPRLIQPSVFKYENEYFAIHRNFSNETAKRCAYVNHIQPYLLKDKFNLKIHSHYKTDISNHNESVIGFNDKNGKAYIVYNATVGRKNLVLGSLIYDKEKHTFKVIPIVQLNETKMASYPNACLDKDGNFIIVYTAYNKSINIKSRIAVCKVTKYKEEFKVENRYIEGGFAVS